MPLKRRTQKMRAHRVTPEAVTAFEAGDHLALHRALDLRPWEPSPLQVDGPTVPAWETSGSAWGEAWGKVWSLRQELDEAARDA